MVAETTATPRPTPKPAYRPTVEVVDEATGQYAVESESHRYIMYTADISMDSCTCPAGMSGRPCKHRHVARGYAEARRQQRLAALHEQYPDNRAALLKYPA